MFAWVDCGNYRTVGRCCWLITYGCGWSGGINNKDIAGCGESVATGVSSFNCGCVRAVCQGSGIERRSTICKRSGINLALGGNAECISCGESYYRAVVICRGCDWIDAHSWNI